MSYEQLNAMSEYELMNLEDSLLMERETNSRLEIKNSSGRFVLLVMSAAIWGLLMAILARGTVSFRPQLHGMISFIGFFVSLGVAVGISHFIWRKSSVDVRFYIRNIVHYWPVTFSFVVGVIVLLKS
ncbi:MAG: hypothetical protein JNL11_16375 [Bdellovibrionaceae bacterium]|nr:hypothetical protein [Pseudobdellovibrionaceae bacterium]